MIRYRDKSHGVTQISVKALKHIERLGKILYVRGYSYRHQFLETAVLVRGENGTARFTGFAWGYGGSGPHGLKQLLQKINVERSLVDKVLNIPWTTSNEIGEIWRVTFEQKGISNWNIFTMRGSNETIYTMYHQ